MKCWQQLQKLLSYLANLLADIGWGNLIDTVNVISSDPPCKDGNARFTTVFLLALSDLARIKTP